MQDMCLSYLHIHAMIFSSRKPRTSTWCLPHGFRWLYPLYHHKHSYIMLHTHNWLVVWNMFLFFHSDGNVIIPTDELSPSFFRGVGSPHGKPTTRQYLTISHHHEPGDINSYEAFRIPMIPITFLSHMLHGAGIFTKKIP